LTDHLKETEKLQKNIQEIILDYLSVGIDPQKSSIFLQSAIPEIAELTMFFSFLIPLAKVEGNPTVKDEIQSSQKTGRISQISFGFFGYPVSQVADILSVRADLVPVGEDQLPHIELTREAARTFNNLFGKVFPEPEGLVGKFPRLPGLDNQKMGKSLGNAIYLSDSEEAVKEKVQTAFTDPLRIHPTDKGHPQTCPVFQYHQAFNSQEAREVKILCEKGEIGCVACKKRLEKALNNFLGPIREKRKYFASRKKYYRQVLEEGIKKTKKEAEKTMKLVKEAMKFNF